MDIDDLLIYDKFLNNCAIFILWWFEFLWQISSVNIAIVYLR